MISRLQIHAPTFNKNTIHCSYSVEGHTLTNSYEIPGNTADAPPEQVAKLCQWIALTGSFSLFSLAYFEELVVDFALTPQEITFFEKLAFLGLGEFRVINGITLTTRTRVIANITKTTPEHQDIAQRIVHPLLLNGGGKDGSVSAWLLTQANIPFDWFQRGSSLAQQKVTATWSSPVLVANRTLDEERKTGPYKGHRPMSASVAFIAILSALITNHDAVITSNEASANEANYVQDGVSVNHQYSKSLEFEEDLQDLLAAFSVPVHYFSLLRPLYELQIACIASELSDSQLAAITSCNNGTKTATWCMQCAKCAFVILVMTASSPDAAAKIWGGIQPINLLSLTPYLVELLDTAQQKPFECVGTQEECHLAANIILRRNDILLTPRTNELLTVHTAQESYEGTHGKLLTQLGDHCIPDAYLFVLPLLNEALQKWQHKTSPLLSPSA